MKTFNVYLRDGQIATVHAETYRHEGKQYLFDRTGTSELQFFVDSEVAGIFNTATPQTLEATLLGEGNLRRLAEVENEIVLRVLAECGGNQSLAAESLAFRGVD